MTSTLKSYKSNFCIFFDDIEKDPDNTNISNDKNHFKKLLNTIYVALKGDIDCSPNFDTIIRISKKDNHIVLDVSGDDLSKFRATMISLLKLIDLIYTTIYLII